MAWGTAPGEEVEQPENVAEERIREIVREELTAIANLARAAKSLAEDGDA